MDRKKNAQTIKIGLLVFLVLAVVFVACHYTLVSDAYRGTGGPANRIVITVEDKEDTSVDTEADLALRIQVTGQEGRGNGFTIVSGAINHAFMQPFELRGLVLAHTLKPMVTMLVLIAFGLMMYKVHKDLYRQDRMGEEAGSAQWFSDFKAYDAEFVDPYTKDDIRAGIPDNNILLAQGLKLSMNTRKTQRNLNTLAVGGSGAGKTYRLIKPNLAQMNCSYVVTDPSGEILQVMGVPMMEDGYTIKLFSISDMKHSNTYNPMDYIYDESGDVDQTKVGILVSTFIKNADDLQKKGGGDPFWTKSSTAWMTFAVLFLAEFMPMENRNLYNVLKLAQLGKTDENTSSQTMLDSIVAGAERKNPKAKCFSSYKTFKLAPAKTANSILISMAVDLNPFSMDDVRNLTTTSYLCTRNKQGQITKYIRDSKGRPIRDSMNLDLETIGDSKTALFVNIPQANGAYNFLISMMYSQLFNALYTRAEKASPNRYHIYDANGMVISSQYKTEEEAERALYLYSHAEVVTETEKKTGVVRHFIYNKEAKRAETLPEMAAKHKNGYLREVYSEDVGKKLIARYRPVKRVAAKHKKPLFAFLKKNKQQQTKSNKPYIARGLLRLPIHVRFLLDEFSNSATRSTSKTAGTADNAWPEIPFYENEKWFLRTA
ncbi:MAG: type IV secretory system conjugative DNA transfer family protein [Clostridiales bacterium]|nr:type IV secretory system conjugative DNA transfer family protein [Clostridiales bacterium]